MNLKRICLLLFVFMCLVILSACSGPESTYKQAQNLLAKGQYTEAAEKFESIGSYEDATTLTMYCKACALCESGSFEAGIQALEKLGDYKDCAMRITYYTARSWDDSSVGTTEYEWMQRAIAIYSENPLYLDSTTRISALDERIVAAKKTLYDNAVQAGNNGQYSTAIQIFERLADYSDSKQRYAYYNIRADEAALATSTDETAVFAVAARYAKMGTYLDCVDRAAVVNAHANAILDEKYNNAVSLMKVGEYDKALIIFKAINGHKDSAEKLNECNTAILDNKYNKAIALMKEFKYEEALAAFHEIKSHKDSSSKIAMCESAILDNKYRAALALLNAGSYQDAYSAFSSISNYSDSSEKAHEAYIKLQLSTATRGNYITFGCYEQDGNYSNGTEDIEWIVLAKDSNRLLVISRYALDAKPYNTSCTEVTWETCTLRKWLNNEFLNTAFTEVESSMIPTVTVVAHKNPEYDTDPGNDTQDKVFLLSIDETTEYCGWNYMQECEPTAYAKKRGAFYYGNGYYVGEIDGLCRWWLRTPSSGLDGAAYACTDNDFGGLFVDADHGAVRPAMYINLP